MRLAPLDIAIIVVFMVVNLAIGVYLTRRASGSMSDFFLSGRNLPWWLAGTSMVATTFSSDTPLYITGLIRKHGIYENWQWWCFVLSGMLAVSFFSRLWRRAGVLTDVELIELRYSGRAASVLRGFKALYLSCVIHTIIKAQVIFAMVKILDVTLGWGKWESIVISSLVTLAYSVMSGFWGVVVTDFLQFIIAMVGAVILAVIAVDKAGGIEAIKAAVPPDTLAFFPPLGDGGFLGATFLTFLGYIGLSWWSKYSSDGGGVIVQRVSSCRSEADGYAGAFFFNVANYGLRTWPWIIAALASMVLYPKITDHEAVYPMMVVDLMPVGLAGLMIASFFAAFMSTLSTYLNLSSAYFVNDFYRPYVRPDRDERHYVFISRVMTIALSILTAFVTFHVTSIIGVFKFLVAFGSGTGLVYIVRWFWWRVNAWSEISAMVASTLTSIVAYTVLGDIPYYGKLSLIISVSTVVWLAVTMLTSPVEEEKLREFVRRVRPEGPGWRRFARAGQSVSDSGLWGTFVEWIAGCALVFGITIGVGKLLLGFWAPGVISLVVAGVAGVHLIRRFRNFKSTA
ncbi:MAG: Na+:solute symporter [Thermodesulfovibrionales bacterium]|nr:Na+:solute symporter [Thermodesulfovibrionales bacterium]